VDDVKYLFINCFLIVFTSEQETWRALDPGEKHLAYIPCVPAVVIELASETDKMPQLVEKVSRFMEKGTREGVVVDTRSDTVLMFNGREPPVRSPLRVVTFDHWPGFALDCLSIKRARVHEGL
jgi:Uma2 family endonuclease